jgi:hypothetical protein
VGGRALSYFEKRLKEVVETIERLRGEGYSWEELYPLEIERRVLEWFVGMRYTLESSREKEEREDCVEKVRDACLEDDPYGFNTDRAMEVARECLPDADEWRCGNCLYRSECRLFPNPPEEDSPLALCCRYFTPRVRRRARSTQTLKQG